jgi:hypothetical protein
VFQASQSLFTLRHVRLTMSLPTVPPNSAASARRNPTPSYVSSGLVNGDTLSGLLATSATTTSNVGAYAITQGTLAASSNYALSYVGPTSP